MAGSWHMVIVFIFSSLGPVLSNSAALASIEFIDQISMSQGMLGVPLTLTRSKEATSALVTADLLINSCLSNYRQNFNLTAKNLTDSKDKYFPSFITRSAALQDTITVINNTFYDKVTNFRNKRAFIDVGGDLLSSIFGVATNKQLELVKNHFNDRLLPMELSIKSISLETKLLRSTLLALTKTIKVQVDLLERNLRKMLLPAQINQVLNLASDIIFYTGQIVSNERSIIASLNNNLLPNIFDDHTLNITIRDGLAKFPNSKFPLSPSNYSLLKNIVQIERSISPREFVILIPFVSKDSFSRYELIPLPLLKKNIPVVVQNVLRFVGISRTMFFESNSNLVCNEVGNFCEGNPILHSLDMDSCSLQLVRNKSPKNCIMDNLNFQHNKPYIQTSLKNSYIFFQTVTPIEVDCGPKSKEIFTKGNYKLSKACSLKSETFTLPAFKEAVFSHPVFFNNNHNNTFLKNLSTLQFVPQFSDEKVFDDLAVNLTNLQNIQNRNFSILEVNSSKIHFQTKILISANSVILIIVILLVVTLTIIWKKRFCNNHVKNSPLKIRDHGDPPQDAAISSIFVEKS